MVKYLIKYVVIINRWWDILMLSGFRGIFWIFDVTILGGEGGVGYCLGFICNFRGLGSGARGTICSCLLHHYYGAKLRKRMNETNILQFIQVLYYMVCFESKCFVYYIFCLLSWQFQKLLTSMSIPALTKMSDPLLKLQPPHHTHPIWSTPTGYLPSLLWVSESLLFNA